MLGLQLRFLEVRSPTEIEAAFGTVVQEQMGVLLILIDPLFVAHSKAIAELSMKIAPHYHDWIPDLCRGRRSDESGSGGIFGQPLTAAGLGSYADLVLSRPHPRQSPR